MARIALFLLALVAAASVAQADDMKLVSGTTDIYESNEVGLFASTGLGSGCKVCDDASPPNCYPNAAIKPNAPHVCTGPCSDTCSTTCSYAAPSSVTLPDGSSVIVQVCGCPVAVCGDPHFVGNNGVEFDFHGVPDHEYSVISDTDFVLNAHMVGQEVENTGVAGTWMSRLGFVYNFQGQTHKLALVLEETADKSTTTDVVTVTFDGQTVQLSESPFAGSGLTLTLEDGAFHLDIEGHFNGVLSVADHKFPNGFHFDFTINSLHVTPSAHGVLGQTFQLARTEELKAMAANVTVGSVKSYTDEDIVEGAESDYEVSGLFETDFRFSRFIAPGTAIQSVARKLLGSSSPAVLVPFTINWSGSSMKIQF